MHKTEVFNMLTWGLTKGSSQVGFTCLDKT